VAEAFRLVVVTIDLDARPAPMRRNSVLTGSAREHYIL
jgi:hypothetical protein